MRRHLAQPYGTSITIGRSLSLLFLLAIVWMLYDYARRPATWAWLAQEKEQVAIDSVTKPESSPRAVREFLTSGPTDEDETERETFESHQSLITDRAVLRSREMPAYWQLMSWSCAQPFAGLEQRAAPEPAISQLWEKPGDYRGQPLKLRLHVRRVLRYEAPENPLGLHDVYEVWGWTDASKSFPYVVVLPELPTDMPVGADVQGEAVFAGYFLEPVSKPLQC